MQASAFRSYRQQFRWLQFALGTAFATVLIRYVSLTLFNAQISEIAGKLEGDLAAVGSMLVRNTEGCDEFKTGFFDSGKTLKHGIYEIYVQKDKDGYPDPFSPFYRPLNFTPETVQLFGEKPEAKIDIKLGEKAGVLRGTVTDSDTGFPLKATIFLYSLEREGAGGGRVDGKFRLLVPARTEIKVLVQADGPRALWSRFETERTLQPGEEQTLDIRLFRNPTP